MRKRALLVIDVQNEYFSGKFPVSYPADANLNLLRMMAHAKSVGIPVVMIQHSNPSDAAAFAKGSYGWELHESVADTEVEHYIEKTLPSSFVGTDLQVWLEAHEVDTVVIVGYMTQACCDTTARHAMHLGYKVEFLSDATATLGFANNAGSVSAEELHRAILVTQASRISEVLSTDEWIAKT